MSKITVDGNEYSDDGSAARDMQNGGHRTWMLPMLGDAMSMLDVASTAAATATTKAAAAFASASAAANYAAALNGTSTSAVTVGSGSKSFTTQLGKQFYAGQAVLIARQADSDVWMYGQVTSYSGTSLVVSVSKYNGTAVSYSDWNINISGIQGPEQTSPAKIYLSERTANAQLGASDIGKIVKVTSGTFLQTFAAAATLGAGWWCYYKNAGTGDVTIDPYGSETIDGVTSFVMYPGETRFIQCDGTGFSSIIVAQFSKTFTSSGTFYKPPGYSAFGAFLWSGGASGNRSGSTTVTAFGGAGGGCFAFTIPEVLLSASETVLVGAGGNSSTTSSGNAGGNTSIGSVATVYGGSTYENGGSVLSGIAVQPYVTPIQGFVGAARANRMPAPSTIYGGAASSYHSETPSYTPFAGNSIYGGACGGGVSTVGVVATPGTSTFGGDGGAASISTNGSAGVAPGGGGGGTQTGTQSGAGARGECRIWGIA